MRYKMTFMQEQTCGHSETLHKMFHRNTFCRAAKYIFFVLQNFITCQILYSCIKTTSQDSGIN